MGGDVPGSFDDYTVTPANNTINFTKSSTGTNNILVGLKDKVAVVRRWSKCLNRKLQTDVVQQ